MVAGAVGALGAPQREQARPPKRWKHSPMRFWWQRTGLLAPARSAPTETTIFPRPPALPRPRHCRDSHKCRGP